MLFTIPTVMRSVILNQISAPTTKEPGNYSFGQSLSNGDSSEFMFQSFMGIIVTTRFRIPNLDCAIM